MPHDFTHAFAKVQRAPNAAGAEAYQSLAMRLNGVRMSTANHEAFIRSIKPENVLNWQVLRMWTYVLMSSRLSFDSLSIAVTQKVFPRLKEPSMVDSKNPNSGIASLHAAAITPQKLHVTMCGYIEHGIEIQFAAAERQTPQHFMS